MQEKKRAVGAFTVGILAGTILGTGIGLFSAVASGLLTPTGDGSAQAAEGLSCRVLELESETYPGETEFIVEVWDHIENQMVIRGYRWAESDEKNYTADLLPDSLSELGVSIRSTTTTITIGDITERDAFVQSLEVDPAASGDFLSNSWCYRKSIEDDPICYSDINADGLIDVHISERRTFIFVEGRWVEVDGNDAEQRNQELRTVTFRGVGNGLAYVFDDSSGKWQVAE